MLFAESKANVGAATVPVNEVARAGDPNRHAMKDIVARLRLWRATAELAGTQFENICKNI